MNAYERLTYNPDAPLKAGDKIIEIGYDNAPEAILTVVKVTPTGIIRTAEGESFKPTNFGDYYGISPYTEELAAQVREYQRGQAEEKARRKAIDDARRACRVMADRGNALPYEAAVKILEVYAAYKEVRT